MKKTIGYVLVIGIWIGGSGGLAQGANVPVASDPASHFIYPEYSKTISMDFKDAALIDVLKILSQQSGLNFVGSQEVANRRITLFLNNVPVEEALERILSANGLMYELESGSGIFIVKPNDKPTKNTITRVYRLKHASVSNSKINKTLNISGNSGSSSGSTAAGAGAGSPSGGLISALKSVLSSSGNLIEDPRTNSLIISDYPAQFALIEQTLARLDVPIPQILIEVEMLDVSKNTADLLGVKFGDTPLTFTGAERDHVYPWNQNQLLRKGLIEDPQYRVGTISAAGLIMTLNFLRTQTDTKNLARPRILTLNNEMAEIKISTSEAIGVSQKSSGTGGETTTVQEAERVQTGVFLTVTPQANLLTGEITMAITPKVIQARTGATFQGTTFKDPEERGTQSLLRVKNGDTIVLGGLVRTDVSHTITKLPFLGDLPVIGRVFRHNDEAEVERELIIFITPHILAEDGTILSAQAQKVSFNPISREQDIPAHRKQEIDKALLIIENKR